MTNAKRQAIYLNDHLAGATVGIELARRTLAENNDAQLGAFLRAFLLPPGSASHEDQASSSSSAVQGRPVGSGRRVSRSHSVPGVQWSRQ